MLALSRPFKILFEGKTITILYHTQNRVLEVSFFGYTQSDELRASFLSVLQGYGKAFKASNWFFDLKHLHLHPDDLEWLTNDWHQSAGQTVRGPLKVAYIPAVNFVASHHFNLYFQQLKMSCKGIALKEVAEFEEAESWFG